LNTCDEIVSLLDKVVLQLKELGEIGWYITSRLLPFLAISPSAKPEAYEALNASIDDAELDAFLTGLHLIADIQMSDYSDINNLLSSDNGRGKTPTLERLIEIIQSDSSSERRERALRALGTLMVGLAPALNPDWLKPYFYSNDRVEMEKAQQR